jgi:type I restriction enzyme, S subunit
MADVVDLRPDQLSTVQAILAAHVPAAEVWAFGSRAKWTAKDTSDLDLAVVNEKSISSVTLDKLRRAFEESYLPFKVDVVDLARVSDEFRNLIRKQKVVLRSSTSSNGTAARPSEWRSLPLEECVETIIDYRGKTPRKVSSGIPLITAKVVKGGRIETPDEFIAPEDYDGWMRRGMPRAGDILLTMEAPLGEVAQLDDRKVALAQRLVALRGKSGLLDNDFLKYLLQSKLIQDQLRSRASGTTVLGIKQSELRKITLIFPSLAEQKAIAAVLGALDDKIELNRRMNAALEAMARALFQSWFVDFDPVRAKLDGRQPPGLAPATAELFPEHLEDSLIGKKPIGWDVTTLENVLAVLETGGRPKGGVGGITSGIPSIGAESVVRVGVFDFSKTKFVPVEFYEGMKKGHIESLDVLLYKDGGRPGEYEPHVSMFGNGFPFETCCINEHVYRLRAAERLSQEYLYFWLTSELAFAEMRIKGTGVAIPGLNSTAVRSLTVLVPPKRIVDAFSRQTAPLISRLLANAKQSRTLASLRDTLLPKLLTGQISPSLIRD